MISDDELLLYYYRDGLDAAERARIGTALAQQPELAQRLHRLVAQLDTVAETPEVPVPPHIEQRWQNALARAARSVRNRSKSSMLPPAQNARSPALKSGTRRSWSGIAYGCSSR